MPKHKMICTECGDFFLGGQDSHLCPACYRQRLSDNAKQRGLNKLGNTAYSEQQKDAQQMPQKCSQALSLLEYVCNSTGSKKYREALELAMEAIKLYADELDIDAQGYSCKPGIVCDGMGERCDRCGFNPIVSAKRRLVVRKKYGQLMVGGV